MKPLLLLHVNHQPVNLITYIETLECVLGKTAKKNYLPMQDRDVPASFAHTEGIRALTHFAPATTVEAGIGQFVAWYPTYYGAP